MIAYTGNAMSCQRFQNLELSTRFTHDSWYVPGHVASLYDRIRLERIRSDQTRNATLKGH